MLIRGHLDRSLPTPSAVTFSAGCWKVLPLSGLQLRRLSLCFFSTRAREGIAAQALSLGLYFGFVGGIPADYAVRLVPGVKDCAGLCIFFPEVLKKT